MSFFDDQLRVVDVDDENRVTIRCLRRAEVDEIQELSRKRGTRRDGEMIDATKASYLMMERSIVRWEGPGFAGREPTIENFKLLPQYVAMTIFEAINEFGELPDAEKKPLMTLSDT